MPQALACGSFLNLLIPTSLLVGDSFFSAESCQFNYLVELGLMWP